MTDSQLSKPTPPKNYAGNIPLLNSKSIMIFDVQSFLIENKEAILSFLQNVPRPEQITTMPRQRSLSRSVSRSVSRSPVPLRGKSNGKSRRSPSRSLSRSPVKSARRSRSRSLASGSPPPSRRRTSRSRSDSRSPAHSARRYRGGRDRSPYSSRGGSRRSRSPYDRRGGGRDFRGGRDSRSRRDFSHIRYADGRDKAEPCRCIGIFGMSLNTGESDLRKIFEEFGEIESAKIVRDHATGRSRGFGFIYYDRTEDAIRAKRAMTDASIDGMHVRVDYSVTHGAPGFQGKSGGGGGGRGRSRSRSRSPPYRRRSRS